MKIGFVGAGNMGGAILRGYINSGQPTDTVYVSEKNAELLDSLMKEVPVSPCGSIAELTEKADVVVLGVKPGMFEDILPQVAQSFTRDKTAVTMAAGVSIGFVESYLGNEAKIVRIMPNTPAMVGEAMVAVCRNANVGDALFAGIFSIFTAIGRAEEVPESLMDCVIGVSGSSPAYTYMYIDALAKAAVKNGMRQEQAIAFAAQSVLGAARMVLETGVDPVQLRINVCSPGGTTIEAVNALLENGFEQNIEEAFQAAVEKSKQMNK